jgi:hypothetical protein
MDQSLPSKVFERNVGDEGTRKKDEMVHEVRLYTTMTLFFAPDETFPPKNHRAKLETTFSHAGMASELPVARKAT